MNAAPTTFIAFGMHNSLNANCQYKRLRLWDLAEVEKKETTKWTTKIRMLLGILFDFVLLVCCWARMDTILQEHFQIDFIAKVCIPIGIISVISCLLKLLKSCLLSILYTVFKIYHVKKKVNALCRTTSFQSIFKFINNSVFLLIWTEKNER